MDAIISVLPGILIYTVICVVILFVRAVFSKRQKRKQKFKDTLTAVLIVGAAVVLL